jgi:hypothetical protein
MLISWKDRSKPFNVEKKFVNQKFCFSQAYRGTAISGGGFGASRSDSMNNMDNLPETECPTLIGSCPSKLHHIPRLLQEKSPQWPSPWCHSIHCEKSLPLVRCLASITIALSRNPPILRRTTTPVERVVSLSSQECRLVREIPDSEPRQRRLIDNRLIFHWHWSGARILEAESSHSKLAHTILRPLHAGRRCRSRTIQNLHGTH